jgi:anterior pharynx defective protein 1
MSLAYVSGLGFGLMSGAFSLVNVLADSVGPGTVGIHNDSPNFFLVSALTTLAFVLLHTCWGVILFQALDTKAWFLVSFVVCSHLLASCLTFINLTDMYVLSLLPIFLLTGVSFVITFRIAGGNFNRLKSLCA